MGLKERIKSSPKWKQWILNLMINPVRTRPRLWLRMLRCFYIKRGRKSVIYSSVRADVVPFNLFKIGSCSVIESFSCVNNMVGAIEIGEYSRVGLGNTIIGPVRIGNHVNLAQGIVISALNHNYNNIKLRIDEQGVSTSPIEIDDDVWIGANSVVVAGVHIGSHSVVAGGSVVTQDVPSFSVVAGAPARVIKRYNVQVNDWERL